MTEGQHKKTTTTNYRFKGVEWMFMRLPLLCYLTLLGVIYIFNAHGVEKKLRKIETLKEEVDYTKSQYMSIQREIMYGSTQSQIEGEVAHDNLKPIRSVPIKISAKD